MPEYRKIMEDLATASGGEVEDGRFLVKPGVLVLHDGEKRTEAATALFDSLNIGDPEKSVHELGPTQAILDAGIPLEAIDLRMAEFAARLTYLSFTEEAPTATDVEQFHGRLLERTHISPYLMGRVPTLLLILDLSTALELLAHKQRVARTSSSRTAAMLDPLFRCTRDERIGAYQRKAIRQSLEGRRDLMQDLMETAGLQPTQDILGQQVEILKKVYPKRRERYDVIEQLGDSLPSSRVIGFMQSASLDNWKWIVDRRLADEGEVETNLIEVVKMISDAMNKTDLQ